MLKDIEKKTKTFSPCLNTGKELKISDTPNRKTKIEPPKTLSEEIQLDFTGKNYPPQRIY